MFYNIYLDKFVQLIREIILKKYNIVLCSLLVFGLLFTGCGRRSSSSDDIVVTVVATDNKIPTARALTLVTDEDKNFNITLVGEDEDGDTLTYIVVENPSHGTLSGTAPNLLYTPNENYSGTDSFTYKVNDGSVDSVIATINITINAIQTATKKTGQTKSYDASGNEVTDGSLKDDGYYQKGLTPQYTRASDIVTDELTELMWQDNAAVASVTKTWLTNANYNTCSNYKNSPVCYNTSGDTAATYCSDLTLGGYTDWRLPTSTELEGIIDYGKYTLAIDTAYFKNVSSNYYWSSTSYEEEKYRAWIVDFNRGDVGRNVKRANGYVRCVRDGQ